VPDEHPLLPIYLRAARGEFPQADGQAIFLPSLHPEQAAIVSFTARAYIATSHPPDDFADLELDGFGSAIGPRFLTRLAGATGHIFMTDMTLVGRGRGGGSLPLRDDLEDHIRVRYARTLREPPAGEPLFAAVSPGNARSVRAFLAMGFVPIGSEVIIDHRFTGPEP
jgi:hypothetical protein